MDQTPHVPHLKNDLAAFFVHGICHELPSFCLLIGPDARCSRPSEPLDADPGGFGDYDACTSPLAIIGRHHLVGYRTRLGRAGSGKRRHEDAVGGLDGPEGKGLEQFVMHAAKSFLAGLVRNRS